ncbi:MAG: galactosyltransferase-related protein, partial [Candidatus Thermoplasmatota archaeon]|nr:galactosyltransferase-related protein [Candidatus Thermoplasmatota archaeon]
MTHGVVVADVRRHLPGAQIVLVDWSSATPVPQYPGATHVRVEGERAWSLARAYNLGVAHATADRVLKLDCDTRVVCRPCPPPIHAVAAGNWRARASHDAGHLNGVMWAPRASLRAVGGYDERIRGYGYDDTDLYNRLGRTRRVVDLDARCFRHATHSDAWRGDGTSALDLAVSIQCNRLACDGRWNGSGASAYVAENGGWRAVSVPALATPCATASARRRAALAVVHGLWRDGPCERVFWRRVRRSAEATTPRELLRAIVRAPLADACVASWRAFEASD